MKKRFFSRLTLIMLTIFAFLSMSTMATERLEVAEVNQMNASISTNDDFKVTPAAKLALLNVDTEAIKGATFGQFKIARTSDNLTKLATKEAVKQNTNFEVRQF